MVVHAYITADAIHASARNISKVKSGRVSSLDSNSQLTYIIFQNSYIKISSSMILRVAVPGIT